MLGANSFKLNIYTKNLKRKETTLTVQLYKASDSLLLINKSLRKKNLIFIFLNDFMENEKHTFSINSIDKEIKSGTYYQYSLKVNKTAEVYPGSLLGSSFYFTRKKETPSIFHYTDRLWSRESKRRL